MAVNKIQVAEVEQFLGLRTDTPASKCPPEYSPECNDMVFSPGGAATRNPFRVVRVLPAEIVYRKEFLCKDGSRQELVLTIDGALYVLRGNNYIQIDAVAPGSRASSVTAYGREYIAFFNGQGGCDAPRFWDGRYCSRVSQGGPGAPPVVSNYSFPSAQLVAGSSSAAVTVASVTPTDQQSVQVGTSPDYDNGYGYQQPNYEMYYTSLLVTTSVPNTLTSGAAVTLSGNTRWSIGVTTVGQVIDSTHLKVYYQTQDGTTGTGGTITPSSPLLLRSNNEVTAATASPHNLRRGFQTTISNVPDQNVGGSITSVVIDNTANDGFAKVTTSSPHYLHAGDRVNVLNVPNVAVGGGIVNTYGANNTNTVTTNTAHGLQVGASVIIQSGSGPYLTFQVTAVSSPTTFSYYYQGASGTQTGGTVTLIWPGNQNDATDFVVDSVSSATTFLIPLSYSNGTWMGGNVTFPWNGTFYVSSVPSSTTFTYRQVGPNLILQSGSGTVTPKGQIPAGDHFVSQIFITRDDSFTAPSPAVKFTASGDQYAFVQQLLIGPSNIKGRILSFTGANGSRFFILDGPAQVNGLQVTTSTRIDDNVTTSAIIDFSDVALLSSQGIDIPGNNLLQQVALNTPRGVQWYEDRLFWIGEKNVVLGFVNMGMDGGVVSGSTLPAGWTAVGSPVVDQVGNIASLIINGPDTGEIYQVATATANGTALIQPDLRYIFRFWAAGGAQGTLVATLASSTFTATASYDLSTIQASGYYSVPLDLAMPDSIPADLVLDVKVTGLSGGFTTRDWQLIYADNPNRNPLARASYVQNPEAYDALTGNIGPNDDSTELRALSVLQESLHFHTERRLYGVQSIGNSEPSSWDMYQVSDRCGVFNSDSVVAGKGYLVFGGPDGAFWFTGGIPDKVSKIIAPTWKAKAANITNLYDDSDAERVYFGLVDAQGNKSILAADYHEMGLGGGIKWCPWNRPSGWISRTTSGPLFALGSKLYRLDTAPGVNDDDYGSIAASYTFAPFGVSLFKKTFDYLTLRISGQGVLTPFLYSATLQVLTQALRGQELSALLDTIAEWPDNVNGRLLYLKLGQPGVQFSIQEAAIRYQVDPNAPLSGVR